MWLFVVVAVGLFGFEDRQAADGIVSDHEGDVDDQLQATAQRRQERVGTEVGIALRVAVERLSEREEPQTVQVAVHGIDPALTGRAARTVGRRHPGLVPTLAEERRERQRPPGVRIGLAEDRLGDRVEEPHLDPGRRRCHAVGGRYVGPGTVIGAGVTSGAGTLPTASAKLAAGIPAGGNGGDGFCAGRDPRTSGRRRRVRPRTGRLGGGESGFLPSVYSLSMGFRASPRSSAGARESARTRHASRWGRSDLDDSSISSVRDWLRLRPIWLKAVKSRFFARFGRTGASHWRSSVSRCSRRYPTGSKGFA